MGRVVLSSMEVLEKIQTVPGADEAIAKILRDKGVPMCNDEVDYVNYDVSIKRAEFPGTIIIKWSKK